MSLHADHVPLHERPPVPLAVLPLSEHTLRLLEFINADFLRRQAEAVGGSETRLRDAMVARMNWHDALGNVAPDLADRLRATRDQVELLAMVEIGKGGE